MIYIDPPESPSIRLETSSHSSATLVWSFAKQSDDENVSGFDISIRNENDALDVWETIRLPRSQRKHTLTNLNCGQKYSVKLTGLSEVGSGRSSEELRFSTLGRRK